MIIGAKWIITGDVKTVLENEAVRIDKMGKIAQIGQLSDLKEAWPEEEVKDYGEATILPGMSDMNCHLGYWYSQPDSFNYNEQMIMLYALQHAQAAFT